MNSIDQLLRQTEQQLVKAGIGDARLEAEMIWMTALGLDRTHLYATLQFSVPASALEEADALIRRRLHHEPTAYLMGYREFYSLRFQVAPGVLIPRPETETLVEEALRLLSLHPGKATPAVADVGTGSGVIAVSIAAHIPNAIVYALDISSRALEVAALNARRHGVEARVRFSTSNLLEALKEPVDLIAANLPYVMSTEIPTLQPEITLHEPREALDGGNDGLDLIRRLLENASAHLKPHGSLVLEMDPRQIETASTSAKIALPNSAIHSKPDLSGRPRILVVELP